MMIKISVLASYRVQIKKCIGASFKTISFPPSLAVGNDTDLMSFSGICLDIRQRKHDRTE